ncbi:MULTISPECIES: sensor domain-containing protein [Deefgea]|uniref:EAL domain-containing protein n=1 Tax=Deefgea chitinilytica TaxID=570276 RepID=A0ABS2CF84_9NEIS|nr:MULTISPECIES: EAL domain-containing protein [Deefgea]MBM5572046.1 EAL domain-containing protein [Deefgea chitinilytica]MBM9889281.1 EAL domain-containing protein [Deefgea sp. CFH1-16]
MPINKLAAEDFDFFRDFLDALPVQCFVKDAQGNALLMNKACEEALGVPFSVVKGEKIKQFFPAEQWQRFFLRDLSVFEAHQTISSEETFFSAKHGQNRVGYVVKNPLYDEQGKPQYIIGSTIDITEQKQLQQQVDNELEMLKLQVADAPLQTILEQFARSFEATFPGTMCSILLLDECGLHLTHGVAPSLPADYCAAIDGLTIGQGVGSCGTAAYTGQSTIVADIASDPLWQDYAALALSHGLASCWSIPIISTKGKVLGTFANYHAYPCSPQAIELQAIKRAAYLIGLAIEHDRAERQLAQDQKKQQEAAQHTQTILDNMVDGVVTIGVDGVIESFNAAASRIFGFQADEIVGRNVSILMPEPHASHHDAYLRHHFDTGEHRVIGQPREVVGRRKNGSLFPMRLSVSKTTRAGQAIFIGLVSDITQEHQRTQEIHRLAFYDALTGLPNRRLLMDRIKKAMIASARSGHYGAVMFLDLDHFKQLNDTHGHDVGDVLLQQVSARLLSCVRESDSVARLGGDEFVILLEALSLHEAEAANQAKWVATKILETLGRPYSLCGIEHLSTPSIGIVLFLAEQTSIEELLKKADVAMYQAKAAGRNTACFFDPEMQAAAAIQADLEKSLRDALTREQFFLEYQIQCNAAGHILGVEALVRWQHPTLGKVLPEVFIPMAEETGVIVPLGLWVLEQALGQLCVWSRYPKSQSWMLAVNMSGLQLAHPNFVDSVIRVLRQTGANPARVRIELTEGAMQKDIDEIIGKMNELKALGVSFSLDHFGTGYSSLLHLKRLPLAQLKIDASFVRDLHCNPSNAMLAQAVISLGHGFDLAVIAEGVECAEQQERLEHMGCDAFQGHLFGRPVGAEQLHHYFD